MINTFENLWYAIGMGLLGLLIVSIRWGVLNIIKTFKQLEVAIKSLENSVSLIQQGCALKHQPISKDIEELQKTARYHTKKLNEHDMDIVILKQKK